MKALAALALLVTVPVRADVSAQLPEWRIAPEATITAGEGVDAGHDLLWVRDALILPSGDLAVLSSGTKDIRVYSAPDRFVRAVGREGEGPGEFRVPSGFRLVPETGHILAYDSGNLRLTVFDSSWEVVRTRRVAYDMAASTPAFGKRRPMVDELIPLATYDTPMLQAVRRAEGVYREELVVQLLDGEEPVLEVRRERGPVYQARDGNTGLTLPLVMSEAVLFDWGPRHIVLGNTHSTEFTLVDSRGGRTQVRGSGESRRANRADYRSWELKVREEHGGSMTLRGVTVDADNRVGRFLEQAPRGDFVPVFSEIEVSDEGFIWAREYGDEEGYAVWQIIDPARGPVAELRLPGDWELLHPSRTHVIVLQRDQFDVEVVRAFRLVR